MFSRLNILDHQLLSIMALRITHPLHPIMYSILQHLPIIPTSLLSTAFPTHLKFIVSIHLANWFRVCIHQARYIPRLPYIPKDRLYMQYIVRYMPYMVRCMLYMILYMPCIVLYIMYIVRYMLYTGQKQLFTYMRVTILI